MCGLANQTDTLHGESGEIVQATGFDYDSVDRNVFHHDPDTDYGDARLLLAVIDWIWQSGMHNPEGLLIRAGIVCWVFKAELHPLQLTQLANGFGKHKQSFGRWHDDFKKWFPEVKTPHMR